MPLVIGRTIVSTYSACVKIIQSCFLWARQLESHLLLHADPARTRAGRKRTLGWNSSRSLNKHTWWCWLIYPSVINKPDGRDAFQVTYIWCHQISLLNNKYMISTEPTTPPINPYPTKYTGPLMLLIFMNCSTLHSRLWEKYSTVPMSNCLPSYIIFVSSFQNVISPLILISCLNTGTRFLWVSLFAFLIPFDLLPQNSQQFDPYKSKHVTLFISL